MSYDDFKIDLTSDDFKWLLKFVFYCFFFVWNIYSSKANTCNAAIRHMATQLNKMYYMSLMFHKTVSASTY